jgi:hypothetical protein
MVGNNPKEDILTSCKATAMIYNDGQKKWVHCASNGPAKIQLLFCPESQIYRIVGRQIQDHEVVLNHSISKGIKYNQATPTFHQWRDQSCVYGLNFSSKLDAQDFGTTMMKILESFNGSTNNLSSQIIMNGGSTLPSSSTMNNNNNTPTYKRQSSQPPTATTVSVNSSSSPSTPSDIQYPSSSPYSCQMRQNSLSSTPTSINNNYYSQQQQSIEDEETNYALISDSYSYYGDNSTNKNNNIPPAPPFNPSMSTTGNAPPPPPPPLPNGFGNGPPPAPVLTLPNANGVGTARKANTTTSAPPMDLMSEMAAKFAQRRKYIDENESVNIKTSPKATTITSALPPTTAGPVSTSPRVTRKTTESHYTSNDLEKFKNDILIELRKDIEKAKQEILNAILDNQHTKI